MSAGFWQSFDPLSPSHDVHDAPMPDGRRLSLPLRDLGDFAVAGLIANQASFAVLDQLAAWLAEAAQALAPEVIVGLPTLGHSVGAATARALGHANWVAPSTTRKRWYDDAASVSLGSITAPPIGANAGRRMWLDPRLLRRLSGRRVAIVDDVISNGTSARAGLALLRAVGIEPVGVLVAMLQGNRWRDNWETSMPVVGAFSTPLFHRDGAGWVETPGTRLTDCCPLETA
jgi:adenine/guanine phosphoribosyltransferase-like PRPP-binding protein